MPKPRPTPPPPSTADPKVKAAVLAVFEKYATFPLSPAQVALQVQAPLPELLLALDELVTARKVREVGPSTYQHAAGAAAAQRAASGPGPREVGSEGIGGRMVPPEEPPLGYGDDARGTLLSAWSKAFALRIVREHGIVASTHDRATRHHLGVRVAQERGLKTDRWFNYESLVNDTDVFTLDQVAQTWVDRRDEEIEQVRQWAAKNPGKKARPSEPLALAEARAYVEKEAIRDVWAEASKLAVAKQPHLHRPDLDRMWGMIRAAEAALPTADLSEAARRRAGRLWAIEERAVLGWALRVEAGKSNEPWLTLGGRPVTRDAYRTKPRFQNPMSVGSFLDRFIKLFDGQDALKAANAMHRDEEVLEIKPTLSRYLEQAKDLQKLCENELTDDGRSKHKKAVKEALFQSVQQLAWAHGRDLDATNHKRLLADFPDTKSTPWVNTWAAFIVGAGKDVAKQTAARRLKVAGWTAQPHNPPPLLRDGKGKVVGVAVPPTPLAVLEIDLQDRVREGAVAKERAAAQQKAEAAERKKRKATRKPPKGTKPRKFWSR